MAERGGSAAAHDPKAETKPTKSTTAAKTKSRPSRTTTTFTFKLVKFQTRVLRKPDEDAEMHLLHSNDWMNAHHFVNGVKVQRFVLH